MNVTKVPGHCTGKTNNVSQAINMAIDNPALWAIMKLGARNAMISTAEKAGIPWRKSRQELHNNAEVSLPASLSHLPKLAAVCTVQPFHASDLVSFSHGTACTSKTTDDFFHRVLACSQSRLSINGSLIIPLLMPTYLKC